MKFYMVLVLIVAVMACCTAQEGTNFYCGRRFSRAVAMLCWGAESKRDAGWWMPQLGTNSLTGMRGKRGPADECCDKPCSVDELLSYC